MAIQTIDLKVPNGDTPRSANTKINANFSNPSHAASRLVGLGDKNLVEMTNDGIGGFGLGSSCFLLNETSYPKLADMYKTGFFGLYGKFSDSPVGNTFNTRGTLVNTLRNMDAGKPVVHQLVVVFGNLVHTMYSRVLDGANATNWVEVYTSESKSIYEATTASGANVSVDVNGKLTRASSSERYKDIISPLELDGEQYAAAMSLNPIVYRSKAEADNPNHHFYSFSAEALGAHDPAFTLWRDTETITDADGNVTEQTLDERVAEGINLNAIVAFLHATNVKQGKLIKDLQDQVNALMPAQQPNN